MHYNCRNNIKEVVTWFNILKGSGFSGEDVLYVLEFDLDQRSNM
jgi:hypothetical protein